MQEYVCISSHSSREVLIIEATRLNASSMPGLNWETQEPESTGLAFDLGINNPKP